MLLIVFLYAYGDTQNNHVLTHSFPTRRSSDLFRYQISRTAEEIRRGAKSRYYPIELSAVIDQIRAVPGRYAVIGIPCFIKAIHLLRAKDAVLRDRIAFTLGLYCGHMKSARMVESFEIGRASCRERVCQYV